MYIDEVDKLARKSSGGEGQRDVGGEGVQQAFLRMIEGTSITIHSKSALVADSGGPGTVGRPRSGQKSSSHSERRFLSCRPVRSILDCIDIASAEAYSVDTSNVLFIFSGAFVGLENIVKQRLVKGVSHTSKIITPTIIITM